jgi:peptidoglycan/LPS O-acetylase OafA/YrhL
MVHVESRVEHLDWLRALAAGLVVFGHSANQIAPGGAVGVSVFFVLSGFLITSILLRDGMMTWENIAKFIARRIARIYPMYVVQIALIVLSVAILRPDRFEAVVHQVPGLLTFTRGAAGWFGYGFGVLWTLAIEFWFYVTFPFLLWAATFTRQVIACIWVGIAVSIAAKIYGFGGETLQYYDQFLIGGMCAAAIRYDAVPTFSIRPNQFAIGIALVLLIAATPYPGTRDFLWFCQSLGTAVGTALVILAGHAQPPKKSLPWLAFLGRISYSVYLMHAVILDGWLAANLDISRQFWLFIAVVLAVGSGTFYLIERPIERRVHRAIRYDRSGQIGPREDIPFTERPA